LAAVTLYPERQRFNDEQARNEGFERTRGVGGLQLIIFVLLVIPSQYVVGAPLNEVKLTEAMVSRRG
jgi:hypothetical protein